MGFSGLSLLKPLGQPCDSLYASSNFAPLPTWTVAFMHISETRLTHKSQRRASVCTHTHTNTQTHVRHLQRKRHIKTHLHVHDFLIRVSDSNDLQAITIGDDPHVFSCRENGIKTHLHVHDFLIRRSLLSAMSHMCSLATECVRSL